MKSVYERIELPLVPVLAEMETRGVYIDARPLTELSTRLWAESSALLKRLSALGVDNIDSPRQVGDALAAAGVPLRKRTASGQLSTDKKELEEFRLSWPVVDDYLKYKECEKLLNTYVEKIPRMLDERSRLHGSFNQAGHWEEAGGDAKASPATGRLSSSGPNLQNIPKHGPRAKDIRRAFAAPLGRLLVRADIGQEEARIAALLSQDERLMQEFEAGVDPYLGIGAMIFGHTVAPGSLERQVAKTFFLAKLYGAAVGRLATINAGGLYVPHGRAKVSSQMFDYAYPGIASNARRVEAFALEHGYVETFYKRRRYVPGIFAKRRKDKEDALRMAVNHPIQGTAADLMKLALRWLWEQGVELVLTVHDEAVVECDAGDAGRVADIMRRMLDHLNFPVRLPVEVSVGPNWYEQEAFNESGV